MKKETVIKKFALTCLATLALCGGVRAENQTVSVQILPGALNSVEKKDVDLDVGDTVTISGFVTADLGTDFQSIKPHVTQHPYNTDKEPLSWVKDEDTTKNNFSFEFKANAEGDPTVNFDVQYDKQTKENVLKDPITLHIRKRN